MVGERKEQRTRAHHNRLARELRGEKSHRDLVEPRPSLQTQLTPPSGPLPSKGLGTGVAGSFECGQGLGKAKAPCGRRLGMHKASLNVTGAKRQAKLEPIAMHKPPQEIDRRTGSRRSTSDRGASPAPIRFPPDNFKHSLTLFSKSFSSFPRGTCSLSVSRPYLALDGIYRPIRAAFPNNPTRRQRLLVRQGPGTTGLSPSPAPLSRGLGPGPSLRTLLQTTIRTPMATDSQAGLFPVRSPLLGESW